MTHKNTPLPSGQPLFPLGQLPVLDGPSCSLEYPANPDPDILLAYLCTWRESRFEANSLPGEGMTLQGEYLPGLPSPGPWHLLFRSAGHWAVAMLGLSEADAKHRAELLARPTAPTGFHRWN